MGVEDVSVAVVAGVWSGSAAAERALHAFRADGSIKSARVHGAVTLVIDQSGDLRTTDLAGRAGEGAVGGLLGATLGLLTSGIGWLPVDTDAIDDLGVAAAAACANGGLLQLGGQWRRRCSALAAVVQQSSGSTGPSWSSRPPVPRRFPNRSTRPSWPG